MRAEEIARLRPGPDVQTYEDIPAFVLQDQGDWSPKTEAGERIIPVHPVLLKLGFMSFVAQKIAERQARLFADLKPRSEEGNFAPIFPDRFLNTKRNWVSARRLSSTAFATRSAPSSPTLRGMRSAILGLTQSWGMRLI
jgi:hypothetical protein